MRGFVPAVVALAISWSATEAYALPADGRAAIDAKLAQFAADENLTSPKKAPTASSTDLLFAIGDILEKGAPVNVSAADLVAGAFLLNPGEKARKDKNTIAGPLITRVINTGNLAANDATLTAIVTQAVSATSGLSSSGKAAACRRSCFGH